MICFDVNIEFILLGIHCTSWTCRFMYFCKIWEDFGHYFFKYSFCPCYFVLYLCTSQYLCVGVLNEFRRSLRLCCFFFIIFSFYSSVCIISIVLSSRSLIIFLPSPICLWNSLVNFSFQLVWFSPPEFILCSLKKSLVSLYRYSFLGRYSSYPLLL